MFFVALCISNLFVGITWFTQIYFHMLLANFLGSTFSFPHICPIFPHMQFYLCLPGTLICTYFFLFNTIIILVLFRVWFYVMTHPWWLHTGKSCWGICYKPLHTRHTQTLMHSVSYSWYTWWPAFADSWCKPLIDWRFGVFVHCNKQRLIFWCAWV